MELNDKTYPVVITSSAGTKWISEMTKDEQLKYALKVGNLDFAINMLLERIKELESKIK